MPSSRLTFKPMLVVFTGAMALTALGLNSITWTRVNASIDDVVAAQAERELWDNLLGTLQDAETGQRGYVITGDKEYLTPFESANLRLVENLTLLKKSSEGDPAALAEIAAIEVSVVKKFDLMKEICVVREREDFDAARAIMATGEGKRLMDTLREAIGSQVARKRALWVEKSSRMNEDLRWGYASALGAGLVALGSGLVAFLLLRDALKHARREQRLGEEKRRAESSDREKSAFLATMSHEIRTPMNAILGFAELLRDRLSDAREISWVDSILAGGRSLLQLINDILDLSKVEAGMMELKPEPTDLRATAQFVRQLFFQLAEQRGTDLRVEVDEVIPRSLLFDNLRLRQILINVVGNAVKFTEKGRVTLRIEGNPEEGNRSRMLIVVEVEDTGRGIPPDQLDKIFQPFVQASGTGGRSVPGTGLGLAIVQRLTRLMRGSVSVSSEVGRGTCFRFEFPGIEISSRLAESLTGPEDEAVDFDDLRSSEILVADDNPTNRELIAGIFEGSHHRLRLVPDGEEAVSEVLKNAPDLVLMDVRMPNQDGFSALASIRAHEEFRLLPVIAVTASSLGREEEAARRLFDGYLRKPFTRAELYDQLALFVPSAHEEDTLAAKGWDVPPSAASMARWRRLAAALGESLEEDYPSLLRGMSATDIVQFAGRLRALAGEASCEPLASYAATLQAHAESFSPDLMEKTLRDFPGVVSVIRDNTPDDSLPPPP